MAFSASPEARSAAEIIALPSIGRHSSTDERRPGSGAKSSTKRALLGERSTKARPPPLRSKSVEPGMIDGGEATSLSGFSSFALYCEVKLKESKAVGAAATDESQLKVVKTCFQLLEQISSSDSTLAAPLQSVTEELRSAIFSDQEDLAGGERKPYFQLVRELEADADRMRRNTAQIVSQAAIDQSVTDAGGRSPAQNDRRKKNMMTQSRILHLETEMHHMFDSVQRADETVLQMKQKEKVQSKLVKDLQDQNASLKFELESTMATCKRAEREADRLSAKIEGIEFERVQLGFGSQDARTQLDSLKAQNDRLETTIAEKNAEIKGANQERARLSFRVQEVKKSILGMVPRGEVDETWKEMGLLKEQVREAQRDAQNWKSKYDALSDEHSEVDDVINYMTPRPDWSKVGQYASGETEGLSSAELVQGLYRTIDEMRGLTGDDEDWNDENDQFEGFGKSKDLPLYLQWEGQVRNRHFSKREMDQFTGEIFANKKKYEKKRGKASTLNGYINTFFTEKFGIQARIAEFGYNMVDSLRRMSTDPFLEQFSLCLNNQLDTEVIEFTIALPERVKKIWEKIDLSNEGKISHLLSKPTLLNSLKDKWPILTELDERKIKQIFNSASNDVSVKYITLIDPEQAELGLLPGERTPLILVLEEALWRDRKAYIAGFIQNWLAALESTGALEGLEDPMAATINAATAKKVMLEVDPTLKEKFVVETLTKAFGSAALIKNKSGKTVTKLKDAATISVGDLGTNLSCLNIYRKHAKKGSQPSEAAKKFAKMFPSMAQPAAVGASMKPGIDRASNAADAVITGRAGVAVDNTNSEAPMQADPEQIKSSSQADDAEALLDAEMGLTVDDDGASDQVAAEFESVLMEIDAASP